MDTSHEEDEKTLERPLPAEPVTTYSRPASSVRFTPLKTGISCLPCR